MTTNNAINCNSIGSVNGQSVTASTAGGYSLATLPGKNIAINGDFQVWQRGAGGAASFAVSASTTTYNADRWQLLTNANQACSVIQTAGAASGTWVSAIQRNSGQTGTGVLRYCTSFTRDMCSGVAGNIVTVSFKAYSGALFSPASGNITVNLYSGTGTSDKSGINGAFTGSATPIAATQAITTTLTNYSFSTAVLSSTVTQLALEFAWTPVGTAGATDTLFLTDVQVEISPVQTPYDRKSFSETLQKCNYFYWKTFAYATAPAQNVGSNIGDVCNRSAVTTAGTTSSNFCVYPTIMRAAPTQVAYNPLAANAQVRDLTAAADCSAIALSNNSRGFYFQYTGPAGGAINDICSVHITSDIDLV